MLSSLYETLRGQGFHNIIYVPDYREETLETQIMGEERENASSIFKDTDLAELPMLFEDNEQSSFLCYWNVQRRVFSLAPQDTSNQNSIIYIPLSYPTPGFFLLSTESPGEHSKEILNIVILLISIFHSNRLTDQHDHTNKNKKTALTDREKLILELTAKGLSKKQISKELSISYHTVDFHLRNILDKFSTSKSIVAVVKAIKLGILDINTI